MFPGTAHVHWIISNHMHSRHHVSHAVYIENVINAYTIVSTFTRNASVSANSVITVTRSYIHTGGLPLTNVSVEHAFIEDSKTTINQYYIILFENPGSYLQ